MIFLNLVNNIYITQYYIYVDIIYFKIYIYIL